MIYRLQKRFILICTVSVLAVIALVFGVILVLNISSMNRNMDMLADRVSEGGGRFPGSMQEKPPHDKMPPPNDQSFEFITPETPFATRHFTVFFDKQGEVSKTNTESIYSITEKTAIEYAESVLDDKNARGWIDNYRYKVFATEMGKGVVFVDGSMSRSSLMQSMTIAGFVLLGCAALVLILIFLLSKKAVKPIAESYEKQKQFITNAGHEMKTPLAIIQSNNDTMALIHGENKYNVHIRNQTKRLNVLMSNLLTLAKLDEEIPLPTETVNISDITSELLPVYAEEAQTRNLPFSVQIEPDIIIQTNKDSFRQMMTILLDNALKYTLDNGNIHLSLSRDGRHTQIITENTCDPSLEPDPERLFERFYRGDTARTQQKESSGYGIGLSAARAICENFGGKLTAEYSSDDSIRFTARF